MNLAELHDCLTRYTDVEVSNREQYNQGGEDAYNYAWKHHFGKDVEEDALLFFVLTGITDVLPEDQYFQEGYDIALLKHDRYAYPFPHKHTFFEILYVYQGHFTHEVEGERIEVGQGELCIVPPGIQHAIHVFDDSIIIDFLIKRSSFDLTFHALVGKANILSDFFTNALYTEDNKSWLHISTDDDEQVRQDILQMFLETTNEEKYSAAILNHMAILLFYRLLRRFEENITKHSVAVYDDKMIQILQYIKDNFTTVTLDELAAMFFFNKYYLSRMIKKRTGKTFVEIVQKTRLDSAAQLLRNTSLHLWEIGHAVGYNDTTHMVRSFKKQFGISPKEYRQQHRS